MSTFKTSFLAVLLMLSVQASAMDSIRWDGVILGGQLGEGWNKSDWTYTNANYFNTLGTTELGTDFKADPNGFLGGAYLGYNFRTGPFISGIQMSYLGADISTEFDSPFFDTDEYTVKINNFATVSYRIGYPYQRWLFSVTAGWAGGNTDVTVQDPIGNVKANGSKWSNGWTVGGGIDYKLWLHMSAGLSFDYIDLTVNDHDLDCDACAAVGSPAPAVKGTSQTQMLTIRVSYLF